MSTKKEEVKATSVEETKEETATTGYSAVVEGTFVIEPTETEQVETKEEIVPKEISFYDDANREVSEDDGLIPDPELITKIKNSHVYNEVIHYKKQLVIKYGDLEVVYSNEKAKELLK